MKFTCSSIEELRQIAPKIWLTESLEVGYQPRISISPIIYGCTAKKLKIFAKISIQDLQILSKSVEDLFVSEVADVDGKPSSVERIVACVPKAYKV